MKREKTDYIVQSVYNALDILEAFRESHSGELDITTIREKFGLSKNTVIRLLATLEKHGYVEENHYTKNYRLGLKNFEISQAYISKIDLLKMTEPILQEIVDTVDESAYIGVLRGKRVVYLNVVETTQAVRIMPRIGIVGQAYFTAIGKSQLSDFSNQHILEQLEKENLTICSSGKPFQGNESFLAEMDRVREHGFSMDDEEFEEGVRCVGAPIRNYTGNIVAGLSISGPVQRMSDERIAQEIAPLAKLMSEKASRKLGYNGGHIQFDHVSTP
ncbi:IclR family transcriptional regulator [Chrysiogenes arsenatis]|uniref:IclR family transcriptional regulator n=1 Tax=Chrysiogenes arsenatis TaxID=309797 RepID=UPI000403AC6D|nr:IclR family transcriptional regulator [Chrysiogenes arsenatis]